MIAGEGDAFKHKAVLLEFLERHKNSRKLDMTNKQGQTALHRAVKSKENNSTIFTCGSLLILCERFYLLYCLVYVIYSNEPWDYTNIYPCI